MNITLHAFRRILLTFLLFAVLGIQYANGQANIWTQKANYGSTGRWGAAGFSIGNKGYVGTGWSYTTPVYNATNDFWEYDPATNVWTQKANVGGLPRYGAVGFSIGTKGYIGTGWNNNTTTIQSDFWEYDPVANAWTQKAGFGGGNRVYATGFSIGAKGYVGAGYDNTATSTYYGTSDFWEYDPATNLWTQKANYGGGAKWAAVGFGIGNKGYMGTGLTNNTTSQVSSDFWEYDPATNTWTQKANYGGGARYYATGFNIGNKGYIGTGWGGSPTTYTSDFWEFDPLANTWTQRANFGGSGRYVSVGFSIGNKGYLGLGWNGTTVNFALNDFWEYAPPTFIQTGVIVGSPLCAGATVGVPYIANGGFATGNVFTAQLSDSAGNFTSPVAIGTANSITSGTIAAVIPVNTIPGIHYRIRIVSSSPAITGIDNGVSIAINGSYAASITISTPLTTFCYGYPVTFSSTISYGGANPVYQWQKNGVNIGTNSSNYSISNASGGDVIRCILQSSGGTCISPLIDTSNNIALTVFPSNLNVTPALSDLCAGDSVTLKADDTTTGLVYQWQVNNNDIPGATNNSITVHTTGSYHVLLSAGNCSAGSVLVPVNVYALPTPVIHVNGNYMFADNYTSFQWNLNGTPIPGANGPGYTATQAGHYSVTVTDPHGCKATTGDFPLAVISLSQELLSISPNPARDVITINGLDNYDGMVVITDLSGREIIRQQLTRLYQVDVHALASGLYLLKYTSKSGQSFVAKWSKQ